MDWLAWGGLVFGVVGVLVGPIGWLRPRQTTLVYALDVQPFASHTDKVEIFINGTKLSDPWVISLRLVARGPADITAAAFESGRLMLFMSDPAGVSAFRGVLEGSSLGSSAIVVPDTEAGPVRSAFVVKPMMFRRGIEERLDLLVDGKPAPRLDAKLANVRVIDAIARRRKRSELLLTTASQLAIPKPFGMLRVGRTSPASSVTRSEAADSSTSPGG